LFLNILNYITCHIGTYYYYLDTVTILMLLTFIGQDISLNVILDEDNFLDTIMYNHTKNVSIKVSLESR